MRYSVRTAVILGGAMGLAGLGCNDSGSGNDSKPGAAADFFREGIHQLVMDIRNPLFEDQFDKERESAEQWGTRYSSEEFRWANRESAMSIGQKDASQTGGMPTDPKPDPKTTGNPGKNPDAKQPPNPVHRGSVVSSRIKLKGAWSAFCRFQCRYEFTADSDLRILRIYSGGGRGFQDHDMGPTEMEIILGSPDGDETAGPCSEAGRWHEHRVELDPSWEYCRIEFEVVDGSDNQAQMWRIDSVLIKGQ